MTFSALESVEDAVDATREFLWPFDRSRWVRLVLVTFFVSGVGGFNPLSFGQGTGGTDAPPVSDAPDVSSAVPSVGGTELAIIAAIFVILVLAGLVFVFIGSVMEFVFVESLRRETVRVRQYWGDRWRQGFRLFGFRVLLGVFTFGSLGIVGAVILLPGVLQGTPLLSLGLLVVFVPILILVFLVVGLVNGFTTMFVVPVMIGEDRPVLSAWRRFWPTLRGEWKEYAVYVVVAFVLQLAGGLLVGLLTMIGAIALAIPFGLLGLLGFGVITVTATDIVGFVIIGIAVVLFGLSVVVLSVTVAMPVKTVLRYYALFVLGDTNEAFDLVATQRDAVREEP